MPFFPSRQKRRYQQSDAAADGVSPIVRLPPCHKGGNQTAGTLLVGSRGLLLKGGRAAGKRPSRQSQSNATRSNLQAGVHVAQLMKGAISAWKSLIAASGNKAALRDQRRTAGVRHTNERSQTAGKDRRRTTIGGYSNDRCRCVSRVSYCGHPVYLAADKVGDSITKRA